MSPKITAIRIYHEIDQDADTDHMGKFAQQPGDYAIVATGENAGTFYDQQNCACEHNKWMHGKSGACNVFGCDCEDYSPEWPDSGRQWPFFNPPAENYKGADDKTIRTQCKTDFVRICGLRDGNWQFIGIWAEAEITSGTALEIEDIQNLRTSGLWAIESDDDLADIEKQELDVLKGELRNAGFTKSAIARAMRDVTRPD